MSRQRTNPKVLTRDIVADALATIRSQLGRSLGVGVAAALGIATLIGSTQLATSADAQVTERIEAARPEVLRAEAIQPADDLRTDVTDTSVIRLASTPEIRAVSVVQRLTDPVAVAAGPSEGSAAVDGSVAAVSGDLVESSRLQVTGRSFSPSEMRIGAHVALIGRRTATGLNLPDVRLRPTIWLGGTPYAVIGIVEDSELAPDLVDQVAIPRQTAIADLGATHPDGFSTVVYVRSSKNDVDGLAETLGLRLQPEAPERWRIEVPRTSIDLATSISADVRNLTVATGALVLLVGAVAIGNAMLRNVYSRFQELGLRRTLGARSRHIAELLLTEAAVIGLLAGAVGTALGYLIAVTVAVLQDWPVDLDPRLALAGIGLAILAALLGAAWPSRIATKVSPAEALRRT